jgi:hypothetical protein
MAQRQAPRWVSLALASILALTAGAATPTNNNDDSCDIAVLPSATLLLPYFEVEPRLDYDHAGHRTTTFTITNVTHEDAIARVTLWTDRGYPVFTFNVYLTGYDQRTIDLYHVLHLDVFAPNPGTGTEVTDRGDYSDRNPRLDLSACGQLPGVLDDATYQRIVSALTSGTIPGGCEKVGGEHELATGYATVDVVGNCSSHTPADPEYWSTDLRYDNILIGESRQVDDVQGLAEGEPLVHIRAIPEGGTLRERRRADEARFPRTFYSRYQPAHRPNRDGRQPLPSQFAARWKEGTSLKIWREGRAGIGAPCEAYAADVNLAVADVVAFDDDENAAALQDRLELTASTRTDVGDPRFPQVPGATDGWLYLNLDRSQRDGFASQAWVSGAVPLGNGCAPAAPRGERIAPRSEAESCDIALLPAATLLLPHFEVDLEASRSETTVFTLTNVSAADRIARVTLWTDYGFPAITFNVYLTGYDVQTIDLFDVIAGAVIASEEGTGTRVTERGSLSRHNLALDLDGCRNLPGRLAGEWIVRMQSAFIDGMVPDLGTVSGCDNVGGVHERAVGYATIDVVRNCAAHGPLDEEYWTEDLAYDNVLIGEWQNREGGSPLVHIRAIPGAEFPRTFYAAYQPAHAPRRDERQPLPAVFATRWREGGESRPATFLQIWREGLAGRGASCATYDNNVAEAAEVVVFDEDENALGIDGGSGSIPDPIRTRLLLPSTSFLSVRDAEVFPQLTNGAIAGWLYLNLTRRRGPGPAPNNWVVSTIRTDRHPAVSADAAALGNGCSPEMLISEVTTGDERIGPLP